MYSINIINGPKFTTRQFLVTGLWKDGTFGILRMTVDTVSELRYRDHILSLCSPSVKTVKALKVPWKKKLN